jgi:hypothetical protein
MGQRGWGCVSATVWRLDTTPGSTVGAAKPRLSASGVSLANRQKEAVPEYMPCGLCEHDSTDDNSAVQDNEMATLSCANPEVDSLIAPNLTPIFCCKNPRVWTNYFPFLVFTDFRNSLNLQMSREFSYCYGTYLHEHV